MPKRERAAEEKLFVHQTPSIPFELLMDAEVAKQLGAAEPAEPLCLGAGPEMRIGKELQHIHIAISGLIMAYMIPLKARTID